MSAINKMSNKKVTMMKLRRIIQMLSEGYSQNDICRETSSSKTTVSGYKKMADGTKLSYQELLLMEDSELEAMLQPKSDTPPATATPSSTGTSRRGVRRTTFPTTMYTLRVSSGRLISPGIRSG